MQPSPRPPVTPGAAGTTVSAPSVPRTAAAGRASAVRLAWACRWARSALLLAATWPAAAGAQGDFDKVQIRVHDVAPGIHMLEGAGGNIGVCTGDDGVFVIDDQFAPLTDKILAAIRTFSDKPVRFVVNTHWHGDHTGGNENLAKAGTLIVAHDNVRKRLSTEQVNELWNRTTPPSPAAALPVVTFDSAVTFHLNGQTMLVFHVADAHTDGDAMIRFQEANVLHTGDCLFNGMYPVIDTSAGGSIDGMIAAAARILAETDNDTKIIPGHGPLADRKAVEGFRAMLVGVRDAVQAQVEAGKSLDETIAARPTAPWDDPWGKGFMKPEMFVKAVYASLTRRPK